MAGRLPNCCPSHHKLAEPFVHSPIRRCFTLTFTLLAIGEAAAVAKVLPLSTDRGASAAQLGDRSVLTQPTSRPPRAEQSRG
jgi:hypothetical protein